MILVVDEVGESDQDTEWVVKGPHTSMMIKRPIELLEKEILSLLEVHGEMRLSQIWLRCSCHLSEVSLALERLKEKGLMEESRL
jgi:DNA-binding MarR family transcriptional regulator